MKVALTIWEDRISPVFDAAHLLLVAEIENGKVIKRDYRSFDPEMPSHLLEILERLNVNILICGAVSETPANIISSDTLKLIPFISGNTDTVLDACAKGNSIEYEFSMPGCGVRNRGNGCGRKLRNPVSNFTQPKEVTQMKKNCNKNLSGKGQGKERPGKGKAAGSKGNGNKRGRCPQDGTGGTKIGGK